MSPAVNNLGDLIITRQVSLTDGEATPGADIQLKPWEEMKVKVQGKQYVATLKRNSEIITYANQAEMPEVEEQ